MENPQLSLFASSQALKEYPESILSWNVNGISKRLKLLVTLVDEYNPDIVCLQEIRVEAQEFPSDLLEERGYRVFLNSAGGQNGVAILSKVAGTTLVEEVEAELFDHGRAMLFNSPSIALLNIYAPNAPFLGTDAYDRKLAWLRSLYRTARLLQRNYPCVGIVGDFNIAPTTGCIHRECLALYPGFLTDELTAAWRALANLGYRHIAPIGEGANYTWWSYKDRGFERRVGMQIDHMLLYGPTVNAPGLRIIATIREVPHTSDHAPIMLSLGSQSL